MELAVKEFRMTLRGTESISGSRLTLIAEGLKLTFM